MTEAATVAGGNRGRRRKQMPRPVPDVDAADHLGLARRAAYRYRWAVTSGLGFEDIVQAASQGVMRAAETFDASRGNKFSTYAMHWARHFARRVVQNDRTTVRVPVHKQESARLAGEDFPIKMMSGDYDLRGDQESGGRTLFERLPDERHPEEGQGLAEVMAEERIQLARALMTLLDERQRIIIRGRFWEGKTLREVGQEIGLTRERARQLQNEALAILRKHAIKFEGS